MDDHDDDWEILLSALKDGCVDIEEEEEEEEEEVEEEEEEEEDDDDDDDEDEEEEGDDEDVNSENIKTELACPFCSEDFDMLGLCCHIDSEHRMEAKTGICPLCAAKVRTNMATHVIVQHESILKALSKKKLQNGGSFSALSLLRKELLSAYLEKKSSHVTPSSNTATNQLLLSFVGNQQPSKRLHTRQSCTSAEASSSVNSLDGHVSERSQPFPSMDKDQEEKFQRSEFVKGLLLSTILEDYL